MARKGSTQTDRLIAIDANSLVHRAYHAFPQELATSSGVQVNAVYGFTSMFLKVLHELNPKYIVCAFDRKEPTLREAEFVDYKATRKPTDEALSQQFPLVKEVLAAFNVPILDKKGYEADDVLGTLAEYARKGKWNFDDLDFVIVTGDKDMLQLVGDNIRVWLPEGNFKNVKMYSDKEVIEKLGVSPAQVVDYKALVGDHSDNIPGVKGIGEKTTVKLLKEYGDLKGIYKNLSKLPDKSKGILQEGEEEAWLSQKLAQIFRDVDLDIRLQDCLMRDFNYGDVLKKFQEFEFRSLITRIPQSVNSDDGEQIGLFGDGKDESEGVDDLSEMKKGYKKIGICFFESGKVSVGISEKKKYFWSSGLSVDQLKKLIAVMKGTVEVVFCGWEDFCRYCFDMGLERGVGKDLYSIAQKKLFDIGISSYFISTSQKDYSIRPLAFANTNIVLPEAGLDSKGQCKRVVKALFEVTEKTQKKVSDTPKEEFDFVEDVDFILPLTTASMHRNGIYVDVERLKEKSEGIQKEIGDIEKRVFKSIGHEFNISSSRQLSDVLFNELKLPTDRKTKTGFSTGEEVLRGLVGTHPCVEEVLEYREKTKLKSTYIDPLVDYAIKSNDGRVHTTYKQLVTTTGRLSSVDPNLQNIPTRSDLGREIRGMFKAPKGKRLVSADYSQIELRVMAHMSGDRNMIDDFDKQHDFHKATAIRLLGKKSGEISKNDRRMAKTINFGILYGMSPFGLASALGIDREKAREYIDAYFEKYSGVKDYMDEILEFARKSGYVRTMWGRRRYVKGVKSNNWRIKMATEREAINMPIQGTAADIMRKAMVEIYKWVRDDPSVDLLLQIHDELVFECDTSVVNRVGKKVKEIMTGVTKLKVPLDVHILSSTFLD